MSAGKHKYIVIAGMTRRLITADNPREARIKFLTNVPRAHLLRVPYEECRVYEANEHDIFEFLRGHTAQFDGQMSLDIKDERKPQPAKRKDPRG